MLSVRCVATFSSVNSAIETWIFRLMWLILPFTAGPLFAEALQDTERPFELGVTILLWVVWAAMLIASMVPRTETLTMLRIVPPMAAVGSVWAALSASEDASTPIVILAIVTSSLAALLSLRPAVTDTFADGSSYGDETRFLLSTPGALLLGPIQLVWLAIAGGAVAGPLFLLGQQWIIGAIVTVVGWALVYFAVPVLHRLSHRWLVFVPAGMVVHDKTALREPQLFRKEAIDALGPAPADTELEDLSLGAPGLALRAALVEPSKIIRNTTGEAIDLTEVDGFVVSPNRPGAVVAEARRRGFQIG